MARNVLTLARPLKAELIVPDHALYGPGGPLKNIGIQYQVINVLPILEIPFNIYSNIQGLLLTWLVL